MCPYVNPAFLFTGRSPHEIGIVVAAGVLHTCAALDAYTIRCTRFHHAMMGKREANCRAALEFRDSMPPERRVGKGSAHVSRTGTFGTPD